MKESKLREYESRLRRFNKSFNLYSRKVSLQNIFEDCVKGALILKEELSQGPVLDIGSGNGLPGAVCAILYPETSFVLCERSVKKAEFLRHGLFQSDLPNGEVFCGRAEDLNQKFPVIVSKGAIPLKKLPNILQKTLLPKGRAFVYSSPSALQDAACQMKAGPFSLQTRAVYEAGGRKQALFQIQRKELL